MSPKEPHEALAEIVEAFANKKYDQLNINFRYEKKRNGEVVGQLIIEKKKEDAK